MAKKRVVPDSITKAYNKGNGDFASKLVGLQFTEGTPLFTQGNFSITTNRAPKESRIFQTNPFEGPFTLDTLGLTEDELDTVVSNNVFTTLNLDKTKIERYVYFGSFTEFMRVNIEEILTDWKPSLYIDNFISGTAPKNTVLSYVYDVSTDTSSFLIPVSGVVNRFNLIYQQSIDILPSNSNDISNINISYDSYEISNNYGTHRVIGYTGSTKYVEYINVQVEGDSFPNLTSGATQVDSTIYHFKPIDLFVEKFFIGLSEFQSNILNRLTVPNYTSEFDIPIESDNGTINFVQRRFTWPTTDGFNLDSNTTEYNTYLTGLFDMTAEFDKIQSNLISRFFVTDSILEFDTAGGGDDSTGRKINKLLKVYGREFDEIKKYSDGISFANTVTYDKKDNTPDELIKIMSSTLGFDTTQSLSDPSVLQYSISTGNPTFSGQSTEMSMKEVDTELWRRLVINAWYLFKSKGSRKTIEFFLKLLGIPECLIDFNEYVYLVEEKLDYDAVILEIETDLGRSLTDEERLALPMDEDGYPKTPRDGEIKIIDLIAGVETQVGVDPDQLGVVTSNVPQVYFQENGGWYNGGNESTVGNNPHVGPYDGGNSYFDQFDCFTGQDEVFSAVTTVSGFFNAFEDFGEGTMETSLTTYSQTYGTNMTNRSNIDVIFAGRSSQRRNNGTNSLRVTFEV